MNVFLYFYVDIVEPYKYCVHFKTFDNFTFVDKKTCTYLCIIILCKYQDVLMLARFLGFSTVICLPLTKCVFLSLVVGAENRYLHYYHGKAAFNINLIKENVFLIPIFWLWKAIMWLWTDDTQVMGVALSLTSFLCFIDITSNHNLCLNKSEHVVFSQWN